MGRSATALAVSAGLLAAVYVVACVLPNGPSDAGRVQFTLDFPVPYRVPLGGVVEPLITISADGQVLKNASYRIETLDAGDVGYIPQGFGHSIENIGSAQCRILIGFNTGRYAAIDLSQWIAGNPVEILATNFSQPASVIEQFPKSRVFIAPQ